MIAYLVNSLLCSGILILVYHFLLRKTTLFVFNRFYLLFSLAFSMLVPLITLTTSVTNPIGLTAQSSPLLINNSFHITEKLRGTFIQHAEPGSRIDYLQIIIIIYVLGCLLLLIRFARNIYAMWRSAAKSEKVYRDGAWLILLNSVQVPHSFLNRIFLNKIAFQNKQIDPEILAHEQVHIRQYHTLDVIFIAVLRSVWWFNPFLFLYRRSIQVNHEFLADAAVVSDFQNVKRYQSLLLQEAASTSGLNLSSQFNYSITKTRLTMMTKQTSPTKGWLTRLTVALTVMAAFFLFCGKSVAQQPVQTKQDSANIKSSGKKGSEIPSLISKREYPNNPKGITEAEMNEYIGYEKKYASRRLGFAHVITSDTEKRMQYLYARMSREQQKDRAVSFTYPPGPLEKSYVTQMQLNMLRDPIQYGVWIDDKRIKNADLPQHKPDEFCIFLFSRLTPRAVKNDHFHYQITLMTKPYYAKYYADAIANNSRSIIVFHLKS